MVAMGVESQWAVLGVVEVRAPQAIAQAGAGGGGGSAIDVVVSRYGSARGFSVGLLAGRGLRKLSQAALLSWLERRS